jgi:hypothetical protein
MPSHPSPAACVRRRDGGLAWIPSVDVTEADDRLVVTVEVPGLERDDLDLTGREGRRAALLPLLPVLDTLERALAMGSSDPDFDEGVSATHRLFVGALHEAGAEPVESVGRPFDPKLHEAVTTVPSDGVPPGTVVRELRRGWRLGDELLRPAQVVVATSPETAGSWR